MKLTTLDEDLRIHQKLDDEPNDVGGLSAQELKEKFDQAGVTIQKYLNETHLPEEEAAVADALDQAKAYADKKAAAVEQGSMKTTVYDRKGRRRDIFDYTDEKVETLGQTCMKRSVYDPKNRQQDVFNYTDEKVAELEKNGCKGGWLFAGTCFFSVFSGEKKKLMEHRMNMVDPDGLFSEDDYSIVVPEGGRVALALIKVHHTLGHDNGCRVTIMSNDGKGRSNYYDLGGCEGPEGSHETIFLPLEVQGGDRLTLYMDATGDWEGAPYRELQVREIAMIILM